MDVRPDVLAIDIEEPVAAVEAHPDAERDVVRPRLGGQAALGVDGRPDRIRGAPEDGDEGVTLGLFLVAVGGGDRGPDQLAMAGQEGRPAVAAELLGEPRRSFDVGEQEGDSPDRLRGTRSWPSARQ